MRDKHVASWQEIGRAIRVPTSAILLTALLSNLAHAQPPTNDQNLFKTGIERELALKMGRALLEVEVAVPVIADSASKIIAGLGNPFLIDYAWRGDAWRFEVRDTDGNTVQRSICDGNQVFAGNAL